MTSTVSTPGWMNSFCASHEKLMRYVAGLPDDALLYSEEGRWNAGRQLLHVHLCLTAMSRALGSKDFVRQTFGTIDRPVLGYEALVRRYRDGLEGGGKAPERFVPGEFVPGDKQELLSAMERLLQTMREQIREYTDAELDTLVLPHPFLGKLTIREFFFLMTEHAAMHQASIQRGLETCTEPG